MPIYDPIEVAKNNLQNSLPENDEVSILDSEKFVHEQLGIVSGYDSFVSHPVNKINIPEVKDLETNFVYKAIYLSGISSGKFCYK